MTLTRLAATALLATLSATSAARAQSAAPAAGSNGAIPEKVAPATDVGKAPGTLSDKLSVTGGVVHPEGNVDPAIRKPTPPTGGTMPVIPPPGSPGGATGVQPK